jgi:hypothetical protein
MVYASGAAGDSSSSIAVHDPASHGGALNTLGSLLTNNSFMASGAAGDSSSSPAVHDPASHGGALNTLGSHLTSTVSSFMPVHGLAILGFRNLGSVQQDFACRSVSASNSYGKTVNRTMDVLFVQITGYQNLVNILGSFIIKGKAWIRENYDV